MDKARSARAARDTGTGTPGKSSQRQRGTDPRRAAAAAEVGVREWGQLLVERGQQLLSRAEREIEAASRRAKRSGAREPKPDRRHRAG